MDAEEKLLENGYEGVQYLTDFSYDDALIGVTEDNRAVYDYEKNGPMAGGYRGLDLRGSCGMDRLQHDPGTSLHGRWSTGHHVPVDGINTICSIIHGSKC